MSALPVYPVFPTLSPFDIAVTVTYGLFVFLAFVSCRPALQYTIAAISRLSVHPRFYFPYALTSPEFGGVLQASASSSSSSGSLSQPSCVPSESQGSLFSPSPTTTYPPSQGPVTNAASVQRQPSSASGVSLSAPSLGLDSALLMQAHEDDEAQLDELTDNPWASKDREVTDAEGAICSPVDHVLFLSL